MINVVILEDDFMVCDINQKCVKNIKGFNVIKICHEPSELLECLKSAEIDLILLDLTLPNIDGIELLQIIKKNFVHIDVIIISARNDKNSLQIALSYGVIDYILKPFKIQRLTLSLEQYKLRKGLLNQEINQEKIDKAMFLTGANFALPKGIDANTLEMIKRHVISLEGYFSTAFLSQQLKISRISLRKYLKYLESTGFVSSKLEYQAKGRPQIHYKVN